MTQPRRRQSAAIPSGYKPLTGSARPPMAGARLLGRLDPQERVTVTVLVRPRPGSPALPDHRHWELTPPGKRRFPSAEEFTATYGSGEEELAAVADFLAAHGLTIEEQHAGRGRVVATGSAAHVGQAFAITLNRYEAPRRPLGRGVRRDDGRVVPPSGDGATQEYRGFEGPVHVPAKLLEVITAVIGLDNRRLGAPAGSGDPSSANSLSPVALAALYNFPTVSATGQTIGLFADASGGACFLQSDITSFINGLPQGHRTPPNVNAIGLKVGSTTYTNDTTPITDGTENGDAYEITQDISTAAAIAQGANINVYMTEDTEAGWEAWLNRAIVPDPGDNPPIALSASWVMKFSDDTGAIGDPNTKGTIAYTMTGLFQKAAAAGITVFLPIGDWGADDQIVDGNCHVAYPNSDPWVTSCGGTIIGSVSGSSFEEWVWSDANNSSSPFGPNSTTPADFGSTGGGVSDTFSTPSYQTSAGVSPTSKNDNKVRRGVPDITGMVALTGFLMNGSGYGFTGTSCVAPLYAGLAAVLVAAIGQRIGFLNTPFYADPSICNDVTVGNNNSGDTPPPHIPATPYYTAGTGWDACSGWGSVDGTRLLTALIDTLVTQTIEFWVSKSTYGVDEVADSKTWPNAFSLVLDGFAPYQLPGALPTPTFSGTFDTFPGMTISPNSSGPRWQDPSATYSVQRLEFPFDVAFTAASLNSFPATGSAPLEELLKASITAAGKPLAAETVIELVPGADPYFTNIDPNADNVFWLSQDLRVFTATPGIDNTPVTGPGTPPRLTPASNTAIDASAGYSYIRALIGYLNDNFSDPGGTDPLPTLPGQAGALTGDSSVTPTTATSGGTAFINYNFAIARVRLRGAQGTQAAPVKVFFRLFLTQSNDTDYQPTTTYLSALDASSLPASPLVGASEETIPFFATANLVAQTDYGSGGVNNQTITISSGDGVWAYFGCFLNVYDPGNVVNGKAVNAWLVGTHHCLVAQIAYDDAPIENAGGVTLSPENSDKLAQRNLQVTASDNPGPLAGHRVPQTFDLRPSKVAGPLPGVLADGPDELMIDWGGAPVGAVATIYWPALDPAGVIALADELYALHTLTVASEANTIQMPVTRGITYVPIPTAKKENIAGLFTVDLPGTVTTGEEFEIIIRRLAYRSIERDEPGAAAEAREVANGHVSRNWRYVIGTFQVTIPVATRHELLAPEESTLAILKWRLGKMAESDRWHAVLTRYISYIRARVDAFGGDSAAIPPSPFGYGPILDIRFDRGERRVVGKVTAVAYDRFGDFEGFVVTTEHGRAHRYHASERAIESVVRFAWLDRALIEVRSREHEPAVATSIVLLRPGGSP